MLVLNGSIVTLLLDVSSLYESESDSFGIRRPGCSMTLSVVQVWAWLGYNSDRSLNGSFLTVRCFLVKWRSLHAQVQAWLHCLSRYRCQSDVLLAQVSSPLICIRIHSWRPEKWLVWWRTQLVAVAKTVLMTSRDWSSWGPMRSWNDHDFEVE